MLSIESINALRINLNHVSGTNNYVAVADVGDSNDVENDLLYALAFSTDLIQTNDPQNVSYIKRKMLAYFENSINSKRIVNSFPSVIRTRDNSRKRKMNVPFKGSSIAYFLYQQSLRRPVRNKMKIRTHI
jgi:hypothetical protein